MNDRTNVFKYILPAFSVVLNKAIKMFIDFSKHMGDPGINSGLSTLENSLGKHGENILFVRRVYDAGVCHGPVPVVKKKLSLRIDTYPLIGYGLGSLYSLHRYIITSVIIFDVFRLDVSKS